MSLWRVISSIPRRFNDGHKSVVGMCRQHSRPRQLFPAKLRSSKSQ